MPERAHVMDGDCWCEPRVEVVLPAESGSSADVPHRYATKVFSRNPQILACGCCGGPVYKGAPRYFDKNESACGSCGRINTWEES